MLLSSKSRACACVLMWKYSDRFEDTHTHFSTGYGMRMRERMWREECEGDRGEYEEEEGWGGDRGDLLLSRK